MVGKRKKEIKQVISTKAVHPSISSSKPKADGMNKAIFNTSKTLKSFLWGWLKHAEWHVSTSFCNGPDRVFDPWLLLSWPVFVSQWLLLIFPFTIHIWQMVRLCANTCILVHEEIEIFINIFFFYLRSFSHPAKKREQVQIRVSGMLYIEQRTFRLNYW